MGSQMDPISIIVAALVSGAAAGLKPTAAQMVKDAYSAIKHLIKSKYDGKALDKLEKDPSSTALGTELRSELEYRGADNDQQLLSLARELLEAVSEYDPAAAANVGVDLDDIRSRNLKVEDVTSTGTGVRVHSADITEYISITGVRSGRTPNHPK
jgi:hypothetical protein